MAAHAHLRTFPRAAKFHQMSNDPEKVASGWITYSRYGSDEAPEQIFAEGWVLYDLVEDNASLAWDAMKVVVRRYPESDYFSINETEAQNVVGHLAAGPLENLLSTRASAFIEDVEKEASRDRRMAWALGGVWQSTTPDDLWSRVQQVADYSFWNRRRPNGS